MNEHLRTSKQTRKRTQSAPNTSRRGRGLRHRSKPRWVLNLQWQDGGRTFGMQSLRNGDRPTWGHRADGVGLAGGAAVALAEKNGL